jgi:hypothetical protein
LLLCKSRNDQSPIFCTYFVALYCAFITNVPYKKETYCYFNKIDQLHGYPLY